jgi:hypothetical protein
MIRATTALLWLMLGPATLSAQAPSGSGSGIVLKIISQRQRTDAESKRNSPLSLQRIVIRLRLSNETDHEINYLTAFGSVKPLGYRFYRNVGEPIWKFLPKTPEQTESAFVQSGIAGDFRYLRLEPNGAIEFEIGDRENTDHLTVEEHKFAVFIKSDTKTDVVTSLESEPFRPIHLSHCKKKVD